MPGAATLPHRNGTAYPGNRKLAVLPHEGTFSILYGSFPVPVGSGYRNGYLARPDEAGRFPVVLLLPQLAGMGSHEKDLCRRLARRGMATLCLDLYRSDGDRLLPYGGTDDRSVLHDIEEAHDFLASEDVFWALPQRCGLLGLDVGGRLALLSGARRPWVGAVAVVSAPLTGDEDRETAAADLLAHVAVPVLGLYGSQDDLIDGATVDEAQRRNAAGQWLLYEGAGHDFLDDGKPGFEPAAAADACERIIQFFLAALPKAQTEDLG